MQMWTDVWVSLSDVLEVRGSAITEQEAWGLLLQIDQIADNLEEGFFLTPENIQLHSNGSVSINTNEHTSQLCFPNNVAGNVTHTQNCLLYSLGMTLLWSLQYGRQRNEELNIGPQLHSVLSMWSSNQPRKLPSTQLKEMYLESLLSANPNFPNVGLTPSSYIIKMYESVLGSSSMIDLALAELVNVNAEAKVVKKNRILRSHSKTTASQTDPNIFSSSIPRQCDLKRSRTQAHRKTVSQMAGITPVFEESKLAEDKYTTGNNQINTTDIEKSVLNCNTDPPIKVKLHMEILLRLVFNLHGRCILFGFVHYSHVDGRYLKDISIVEVEFVNGRRIAASVIMNKTTCQFLLDASVNRLVGTVDCSIFGLAVYKGGEYIFVQSDIKLSTAASMYGSTTDPHFYLRMKFIPRDFQSDRNQGLLHSINMQTRKDILQGRIFCLKDQALQLAAYALQYEHGDTQGLNRYFVPENFIPPGMVEKYGRTRTEIDLKVLHSKLVEMPRTVARELYLCKARELMDFGTHFHCVYWSKKCVSILAVWLTISPHGISMFDIQQHNVRKKIHVFQWEHLKKIGFKNTAVSISTNEGTKLKFFVKNPHKSKYLVQIMGNMHQFYKYEDFQCHNSLLRFCSQNITENAFLRPPESTENQERGKERTEGDVSPVYDSIDETRESMKRKNLDGKSDRHRSNEMMFSEDYGISSVEKGETNPVEWTDLNKPPKNISGLDCETFPRENSQKEEEVYFNEIENTPENIIIPGSCQVELQKMNGTFGFSIMGGSDKPTGFIKVQHIVEGGAAEMNGNINKGDIILGINQLSLCGVTHKKAVEVLSNAPALSVLTLQKAIVEESDSNFSIENEIIPYVESDENVSMNENVVAVVEDEAEDQVIYATITPDPKENMKDAAANSSYDDRILQVASAYYNHEYTDVEPEFQHMYIGSGGEDISFKEEKEETHEEVISRGEGDGLSNLSGQDHKLNSTCSQSIRSTSDHCTKEDNIPRATSETIADFEEFKRRLFLLKKANESSDFSEDNDSWSTTHG